MGSIYQRKDGRWVGVIELGKDELGKRKKKYIYGKKEKEVKILVNKFEYELANNLLSTNENHNLINLLNEYHNYKSNKTSKKWETTTQELYRNYIDHHFKPYFENAKLNSLKPIVINKFYSDKHNDGLSANMVRKLHVFLKSALNYAVKNEYILKNPCDNVEAPEKTKYKPVVYEPKQFKELLSHVKDTDDEIPIILAAGCGLRRGEIFGLNWCDIDFEKNKININKTVTRYSKTIEKGTKNETSNRVITCPEYVINTLKSYKLKINPTSDNSKIVSKWLPQSYSERFKKLLDKFGMQHIRLHDLRHYNAVIMMLSGISDKVAAERLGHSQVTTLREVYQHVIDEMDVDAANKINNLL